MNRVIACISRPRGPVASARSAFACPLSMGLGLCAAVLSACGGGDTSGVGGSTTTTTSMSTGGSGGTGGDTGGTTTSAPACKPTGGGPYWLAETEDLSFQVSCLTGEPLKGEDFELTGLPLGAAYDPATSTVSFTPGLNQAAVYEITLLAKPTGEQGVVKVGVADKWDDPANIPVLDPLSYGEEYGLPVLFLSPVPATKDYTPATVIYRGHTYTVEAKQHGAASLNYPKKSYTLEFPKDDKFNDPDEAGGFKDKRRIILLTTFDDNSFVRQRLGYDMWNKVDPANVPIQTYAAVVYLDNQYVGLYDIADQINGYMMEDFGYLQDGNLYKSINHDANFTLISSQNGGIPKDTPHQGYVKVEGTPLDGEPGAYDDIDELVTFVATSDSPTFLAGIDDRINRPEYENWWYLITFMMGDDSAAKNNYHYHDPTDPMGKFHVLPWDLSWSFGETWLTMRQEPEQSREYWENELFNRFVHEPSIGDPLRARYNSVLHGAWSKDKLLAMIDGYTARIDKSAKRDEARWTAEYQAYPGWSSRMDFTTYEGEIAYLKDWVSKRWDYQDAKY